MRSVLKALITNLIFFVFMTALCVFMMIIFRLGLHPFAQIQFYSAILTDLKTVWFTTLILSCALVNLRCFLSTGKKTIEVLTVSFLFAGGLLLFLIIPPAPNPLPSAGLHLPAKAFISIGQSVAYVDNRDQLTANGVIAQTDASGKRLSSMQGALISGNTMTGSDFSITFHTENPVYDAYYKPDYLSQAMINTVNRLNSVMTPQTSSMDSFSIIIIFLTACMCFGTTILRSTRSLLSNVFLYLGFILLLLFLIGFPAHPVYNSLAKMTSSDFFPQPFAFPLIGALTVFVFLHLLFRVARAKFRRHK